MTRDLAAALRALLRSDPRVAIVLAEVLGPPVGSPAALPRPWEG